MMASSDSPRESSHTAHSVGSLFDELNILYQYRNLSRDLPKTKIKTSSLDDIIIM